MTIFHAQTFGSIIKPWRKVLFADLIHDPCFPEVFSSYNSDGDLVHFAQFFDIIGIMLK